jgi:hypothetical protein
MYPHDDEEVLKIRLSDTVLDDHIVWFYECSGIFMVRSAYNLVVDLEWNTAGQAGRSSRIDGSRPIYEDIWLSPVPQKVHIFVWRLA